MTAYENLPATFDLLRAPENLFLWAALATGLAAFLASALFTRGQGTVHLERAQNLARAAAGLLVINLLLMVYYFVAKEIRIEYVHSYTEIHAPLAYRVAGLWGGQKGTILMWGTFASLALVLNQALWERRARAGLAPAMAPDKARAWILLVGLGVVLAFVLLMLVGNTWERTDAYLLSLRPDGVGLQPVLRTPFMVIHPPLQFVGYAITVLLFAAGIAFLVTRDPHWADIALPWARLAFLIQTIGLGLGGLWAYYVLNFGGYWAWDPVETANLLIVLPLIFLVHALIYYRKRAMFQATAPLFAILVFVSTLFSTIATRSGLWVSVHAFTDPSQNFARDPLTRFLNILEASGPILTALTSLLMASILVAVLAYLWRVQRDALVGAGHHWTRRLGPVAFFLFAAYLAVGLLEPAVALGALFELSHTVWPANASFGLALVLFGTTVVLAAPSLTGREETTNPEGSRLDRWVTTANLVFLGMVFVALAYLVVFLLDVMSVNGYHRSVYDERIPLLLLPIFLLMGIALGHPTWGKTRSLAWAGSALGLGLFLAFLLPQEWQVALVLPPLAYGLLGASVKLFKVSDDAAKTPFRLRVAGALLLFGGIAALAYWSNPPTRIPLGLFDLYPTAWWAVGGYPAGLLSVLAAVAVLRTDNYRLAVAGSLALIASLAWIVGPLLGLVSLVLVRRNRERFHRGRDAWDLASTAQRLTREYRKTGVYLIHVSLCVGMMGYALSTYLQPEDEMIELTPGQSAESHGYRFTFTGTTSQGLDPTQAIAKDLTAHVQVSRGGRPLHEAPLTMWLELREHYAERVQVERYPFEDVYLRPVRFTVQQTEGQSTFTAHDDNVRLFPNDQVVQVLFTVRTLPGMHLLWAGLWGLGTGMLLNLAAGGFRFEARGFAPSRQQLRPPGRKSD